MSETQKHAALVAPYVRGNTLDIGSSGFPVCKHAMQLDLPEEAYLNYNRTTRGESPIHWRGDCRDLPFKDGVLSALHSSHVLEDLAFQEWAAVLKEWARVIRVDGFIIIACPSHSRFRKRINANPQLENMAHKFEPELTDLPKWFATWQIVHNDYTSPEDYSMIFVARKLPQSTVTEVPMSEMAGGTVYV